MVFKVQVGPAQIAIHQGQSVLVTKPDGEVKWPSKRGLYFRDTRVISAWGIFANGEPWELLNGGAIAPHAARIFLTNRAFESEGGSITARKLGLVIDRHIDGGLNEDIDVVNNSQKPVRFNLEIAIRADFADLFQVKSDDIVRRGRITTSWSYKRQVLRISYRNRDFYRAVLIRCGDGDGEPAVRAVLNLFLAMGGFLTAANQIRSSLSVAAMTNMAKGYSTDLRTRAVALVEAGESRREVARLLDLAASTTIRWMDLWQTTGSVAAKPGTAIATRRSSNMSSGCSIW